MIVQEFCKWRIRNYRIYPCVSRPFMASKEAPKIALDLYMGQRF